MRTFANPFHVPTHRQPVRKLRIAVVGAGYWGTNLARNLHASPDWDVVAICDLDMKRASKLAATLGDIPVVESLDKLLETMETDAVAIATPARTHYRSALTALRAGKHVLVEQPLADIRARGLEMVAEAEANGLVLMADHAHCYTPAVLKMQELVRGGALGEILFVDSVRLNLGLVKPDVDVFWDLAPHDLAILDFVLPGGLNPAEVSAFGADPLGTGRDCVGHLNFRLPNDATARLPDLGGAQPVHVQVGGGIVWKPEVQVPHAVQADAQRIGSESRDFGRVQSTGEHKIKDRQVMRRQVPEHVDVGLHHP